MRTLGSERGAESNLRPYRDRFPRRWSQVASSILSSSPGNRRLKFQLRLGHRPKRFDTVDIEGSLDAHDCKITYLRGDRKLAVAVVHRDLEGLRAEVEFERTIDANEWTPDPGRELDVELRHARERTS